MSAPVKCPLMIPAAGDERSATWLAALDERHLADLTVSETARALRALSSCYVERRAKVGAALDTAGKRAAFALFYAPLHFIVVREIVRALPGATTAVRQIHDLGCGTGAAGAGWAVDCGRPRMNGIDRHPWAVAEANWTYRQLGLDGKATQGDVDRVKLRGERGDGILAAYTVNELPEATRDALLPRLLAAHDRGVARADRRAHREAHGHRGGTPGRQRSRRPAVRRRSGGSRSRCRSDSAISGRPPASILAN